MTGGTTHDLRDVRALLARTLAPASDAADHVDRLRLLEEIQAACAAAQAVETAGLVQRRRTEEAVAGVPAARRGKGVAGEVALALRTSPHRAQRFVQWATVLTRELPHTFDALREGRTTRWRTVLVARETAVLSREQRAQVDREVAPRLEGWGDRKVESEVATRAYRLDPAGAVARTSRAAADRGVTLRPAPDTMGRLTILAPIAQAVAAYAALTREADGVRAAGDPRGRGQCMADTAVERLTGQAVAADVPVEVHLVMSEQALLDGADEPAVVLGGGPVPAGTARELALAGDAPRWLRRAYVRPATGELVALDSRRREFGEGQRRWVRLRDGGTCRTPWCDAPVRHTDHVTPWADGGATSVPNAQGLCETCNHTKQATGWTTRAGPDGVVTTTTPTGHRYRSRRPDLPRTTRTPRHVLDVRWYLAA